MSLIAKKLEREISRVFSAFCFFLQSRKKSTFSRPLSLFSIFGGMHSADSCQSLSKNCGKLSLGNIVALIYKCIFSCTFCVPAMFQVMSDLYVKI